MTVCSDADIEEPLPPSQLAVKQRGRGFQLGHWTPPLSVLSKDGRLSWRACLGGIPMGECSVGVRGTLPNEYDNDDDDEAEEGLSYEVVEAFCLRLGMSIEADISRTRRPFDQTSPARMNALRLKLEKGDRCSSAVVETRWKTRCRRCP